ncbi:hypothetical protein I7I50_12172 [Histoplasma capsulatum G186AR]|uniref:Uncharacterized protein n=1 Tax=Ajellomyces capsulatus TaxID=5037 RepID=A0A8H7YDM0_AJECA|nr:hypothetical protein I7I52_11516 [Histoplasma capsulatum]QSS70517.1 hypothetical protein I7I50_12172 [Histoplasma capsulatum G186AR]
MCGKALSVEERGIKMRALTQPETLNPKPQTPDSTLQERFLQTGAPEIHQHMVLHFIPLERIFRTERSIRFFSQMLKS